MWWLCAGAYVVGEKVGVLRVKRDDGGLRVVVFNLLNSLSVRACV